MQKTPMPSRQGRARAHLLPLLSLQPLPLRGITAVPVSLQTLQRLRAQKSPPSQS